MGHYDEQYEVAKMIMEAATPEEGSHYESDIEPVHYIKANNLNFFEGNVIKYVTRWRKKDGVRDLYKARNYIDMLIEQES